MKSRKAMGLITPNKTNAKRLAEDLGEMQAELFRLAEEKDFLDQDSGKGHLNFELNKLGVAIAAAVKNDLRQLPDKKIINFYVMVLEACWATNNYEIGARIKQGIEDARLMDIPDANAKEFPAEDPAVTASRETIKALLAENKKWTVLKDRDFPRVAACKEIYREHMSKKEIFIPSIQALMNYIAIRLDNASSIHIDEESSADDKAKALLELKYGILEELKFYNQIFEKHLPRNNRLNFGFLRDIFKKEMTLKVNHDLSRDNITNTGLVLDRLLKLPTLKKELSNSLTARMEAPPPIQLNSLFVSSSGKIKTPRSARGKAGDIDYDSVKKPADNNDHDDQPPPSPKSPKRNL